MVATIALRAAWRLFLYAAAASLFTVSGAGAQLAPAQSAVAPAGSEAVQKAGDYSIGPGDVLAINIAESPELSGKFRVAETGYVRLPGVPQPIKAEGLSATELGDAIAQALKSADLIRDSAVSVFVEEFHSRTVTVLGAVAKPSVYPLQKPTTVLEVLSMAGGLIPTSGNTLTLLRRSTLPGLEDLPEADRDSLIKTQSTLTIDLPKLVLGQDPSLNVEVQPGDVVSVSTASVIYVVGAVMKPGGYVVQNPTAGLTVLQALGLAEGLKPIAGGKRSLIIRRSASGQDRKEIPVDIAKLMEGKAADQPLEPNDILFIPESPMKKSLRVMADTAIHTVSGVVIYGLGYGIAR